jgi:hypothetical protein
MGVFRYKRVLTLDNYMVVDISDEGVDRLEDEAGHLIDQDDLRTVIRLFGGASLMLSGKSRIVIDDDGRYGIETLIVEHQHL